MWDGQVGTGSPHRTNTYQDTACCMPHTGRGTGPPENSRWLCALLLLLPAGCPSLGEVGASGMGPSHAPYRSNEGKGREGGKEGRKGVSFSCSSSFPKSKCSPVCPGWGARSCRLSLSPTPPPHLPPPHLPPPTLSEGAEPEWSPWLLLSKCEIMTTDFRRSPPHSPQRWLSVPGCREVSASWEASSGAQGWGRSPCGPCPVAQGEGATKAGRFCLLAFVTSAHDDAVWLPLPGRGPHWHPRAAPTEGPAAAGKFRSV